MIFTLMYAFVGLHQCMDTPDSEDDKTTSVPAVSTTQSAPVTLKGEATDVDMPAAALKNEDEVKAPAAIKESAAIDQKDEDGERLVKGPSSSVGDALVRAADKGELEVVKRLLEIGMKMRIRSKHQLLIS